MSSQYQAYFKILGIEPTSDQEVIKKAYRKKVFQYHPDRNKLLSAHQKFIELTEAYEKLTEVPGGGDVHQTFGRNTSAELLAKRMQAARERYRNAQLKEAVDDRAYYNKLIGGQLGQGFKWFGYVTALFSVIWIFDYLLKPVGLHVDLSVYFWNGPEICFDIKNVNYCFDSRQAAGLGRHWEADAFYSPLLNDLKFIVAKDYGGDFYRIYPFRTMSSSFPYLPILMFVPFLTWRFRQPAPWFVLVYFFSWALVGGMLLFRIFSLFY